MLLDDRFIDDLIRLRNRYPGLVWRLWEEDGIRLEFFLEELAMDCSACLQRASIPARHCSDQPRVVHIPAANGLADFEAILHTLRVFLEKHSNPM